MNVQDTIRNISDCWQESRLSLVAEPYSMPIQPVESDMILSIVVASLLVLFIIFNRRVINATFCSFSVLTDKRKIREVFNENYNNVSIRVTFLICLPLLSFILCRSGVAAHGFLLTLAAFAGFFLFKQLSFLVMSWLWGKKEAVQSVYRLNFSTAIIVTLTSLPVPVILRIVPDMGHIVVLICLGVIFLVWYLLYLIKSMRIFISSGFSHFLGFLYLCGLELLPVILLADIAVRF
ncbi:MAG: DUF4271 domain-containing protein [Bacteroidales bacterium]|jgi:hypothetical protein|nr:DUF4271 domain-containing protein [Bacteroidales bacterium]